MRTTSINNACFPNPAVFLGTAILPILWPIFCIQAAADEPASEGQPVIELRDGLMIDPVGEYGRRAFHTDAIEYRIATGAWSTPHAGDTIELADGPRTWRNIKAADDGWFKHDALNGGYLFCSVTLAEDRIMLLDASGHSVVYVNGEIRTGDPYTNGLVQLPVQLRAGENELLFHCRRGQVRARLSHPPGPYFIDKRDMTLPDLIIGEVPKTSGAILIVNATSERVGGLEVRDGNSGGFVLRATSAAYTSDKSGVVLKEIPPLGVRKITIRLNGETPVTAEDVVVDLKLLSSFPDSDFVPVHESIKLRARHPDQSHKRTFQSRIDLSVQYYAIMPAQAPDPAVALTPGLVLTLHGASVEATSQIDSYTPKSWAHIVAPTNRRPYGFDWEDWGRYDALEVMQQVQEDFDFDPQKIYLTGHSMGGHGTWHLGALYPARFAAIGPSAGWSSFGSYTGAAEFDQESPVARILQRAVRASDTMALARNYRHHGVYILHGELDDNVPVTQARRMRDTLKEFHEDLEYHEQPGAGHWWDDDPKAPGVGCVDWPAMFEFFSQHQSPAKTDVREVNFITVNPAVSATCDWVQVEAQQHPLEISEVSIVCDPLTRTFTGSTKNVSRMALDLSSILLGGKVKVELDGQQIERDQPAGPPRAVWLERKEGKWSFLPGGQPATLKGPHRYGPFKEVFNNQVAFVYGTGGTRAENAWALAKARYDAETFWYRGNAAIDVLSDAQFQQIYPQDTLERNVVLYGNADTNRMWSAFMQSSPVQIGRGRATIGDREWKGGDLGGIFIYPKPHSSMALVGVVGGTGLAGMRLTERLPYFTSGVGYPDCIIFSADVLRVGDAGVKAAGYFGSDWKVESGDFAYP
jgi:dienelactone hydrolase